MKKLHDCIDRFCVLHPNFGISGLMRYIIAGNVLIYLLSMFSNLGQSVFNMLSFRLDMVLQGELWRLVTFPFVPLYTSPLSLILSCYFYYWIGTALEREWGTAKFTIYYLSGALLTLLGVTAASLLFGISYPIAGLGYVNLAMFLAFATLYPDAQVLLFFILPIKIKWLAWLDAVFFAIEVISAIAIRYWAGALIPMIALLNFFVFFSPELAGFLRRDRMRSRQATHFHNNVKQTQREQRAQGFRHKCTVCGRTDTDHPELTFRYCSRCAGYHCYCSDHIFDHVHITDEFS